MSMMLDAKEAFRRRLDEAAMRNALRAVVVRAREAGGPGQCRTTITNRLRAEQAVTMARYFFHIDYGEYLPDMEGVVLASANAARAEAATPMIAHVAP